ncbi:unannotated protein [freshwater metagenome]|uniref:Unannotated protein n=1 Tax=freshwater metagenome TaxID=449393 RepID=A0A6J6TVU0_9ZZZZ
MAVLPRACSGERYCGVPMTWPVWVRLTLSAARAMPKSVTLTCLSGVTSRLAGFTSRWTMPAACAAAIASAAWAMRAAAAPGSMGEPGRSSADNGWPSTSSMTR